MRNETTKTAVPKLRFPEFKGAEGWEKKELGEICEFLNNRRKPVTGSYRTKGPYPYYGASGIVDYVNGFLFNERLLLVGEDGAKWGAFEKTAFIVAGEYWVNNHAHVLQPIGINDTLLEKYLVMLDLAPFVTGAAPPKLTLGKLKGIPIPVPPTQAEQKKIAAALSSLDDLLTAQNAKLAALQAHKRGLMQGLFPAEGETVPKLRFPEFLDAAEWKYKNVAEIAKVTTGNKDTQNKIDKGLYPFFVRSQNVERINSFSYDGEAILTSGDGVGVGKNFHYINGKFDFHQRVYCIYNFTKGVYGKFVFKYFSEYFGERVQRLSAKNSVDSVRMSMITEMQICFPSFEEQQKIADCLTSLDNRITAQTQKIEALKLHKKGLMQGLFPAAAEPTA